MATDPTLLVTNEWRLNAARQFIEDISDRYNDMGLYLFFGSHVTVANSGTVPANDDIQGTMVSVYRNMIGGKRLNSGSANLVIPNYPWTSGTVYAMYDDADPFLLGKQFYAIVNAGSFYHVWKVLDNNHGAQSSISPVFSDVDSTDDAIRYNDGYLWKYMYTADGPTVTRFGTSQWFPVVANSQVAADAVAGTVDVISVDTEGSGYNNWLQGTLLASGIQVNGNSILYAITGNSIHTTAGYYTGCMFYLSSGTGAGQYQTIQNYFSNANGNFLVLGQKFSTVPTNGTGFQIYPGVTIVGDSTQTVNAAGMALVNAAGNTIYRIQMLANGAGYSYLQANVVANAVVGVTNTASVRAIYSPPGGHGFDAAGELGCNALAVAGSLANSEANTIPANNQYQQVGLLADPLFANTVVFFSNNTGTFQSTETVSVCDLRLLANGLTVNTSTPSVSGGILGNLVFATDWLMLASGDGVGHQLSQVASITNSSTINISSNCLFACTQTSVYLANLSSNATMVSINSGNSILVANIAGTIQTGDVVLGHTSGGYGVVDQLYQSNTLKGFGSFTQLYQFHATQLSGSFSQNEQIYQGLSLANSASNAWVHSVQNLSGNDVLVLASNVVGPWNSLAGPMTGANSGATANVTVFYSGQLQFGTGRVLILENIDEIPRTANTTENFAWVLRF